MPRDRLRLLIFFVAFVLLAAVLVFSRPAGFSTIVPTPTFPAAPQVTLTPPSIDELVAQFPQLERVLRDPDVDSIYKDFLVAYQRGGLEAAEQLARARGLLTPEDEVRVMLMLDTVDTTRIVADLETLGVRVLGTFEQMIDISIPLSLIVETAQSEDPAAVFEKIRDVEHVIGLHFNVPSAPQRLSPPQQDESLIHSEGLAVINAEVWHAAGFTGRGLKIGILDQGFDGYADLLGSELPEQVGIRSFIPGIAADQTGEDHGTAVAEIIYDIAPDAELYLAYYDGGDVSMGNAVQWLLDQDVQIISHSAGGLAAPMDGSGPDAELVDRAAAQGVLWINSAGNSAREHYRATFIDLDGDDLHDFNADDSLLAFRPVAEGATQIVLSWNDWPKSAQDYDLYLLDRDGVVLASSRNVQNGNRAPVEQILYRFEDAGTYYVAVQTLHDARPLRFDLYIHEASSMQHTSPSHSLATPADARAALSVGAAFFQDGVLQPYSSYGPTNDGRQKPEVLGPDGIQVATYVPEPFFGTSAAAPHIAGAAALVWQAYPDLSADDVRAFLLTNTLGPAGEASGSGSLRLPAPPQDVSGERPTPVAPVVSGSPARGSSAGSLVALILAGVAVVVVGSLWMLRRRSVVRDERSTSFDQKACAICGLQMRAEAQFCSQCGRPGDAAASRACVHCAQRLRPGATYCSHCGYATHA